MGQNITNYQEKTPAQPTGKKSSVADGFAAHVLKEEESLLSSF